MEESVFLKPLVIVPHVQHYHWGLPADLSLVGKLTQTKGDIPCAELWIGAHPDLPADILVDGVTYDLKSLIDEHPLEMLGHDVIEHYGRGLPFLFKILSVGKPLSIQAHPDKKLAERLYRDKGYPDENHKPEMGIALRESEILCGFRHLSDIAVDFARLPELKGCIGEELFNKLVKRDELSEKLILKELCSKLLMLPEDILRKQSALLRKRLEDHDKLCRRDAWALKLLSEDFIDGDAGIFILYTMNLMLLSAGDAIFIPPNTAHAYLSGEFAECMANSDNVVRGGLTPKSKDIETLLTMLDYTAGCPTITKASSVSSNFIEYLSPLQNSEFKVQLIQDGAEVIISDDGPAVILSIDAVGRIEFGSEDVAFQSGNSFFIPASGLDYTVVCDSGRCFLITVPLHDE